jgi:hypothetical protein
MIPTDGTPVRRAPWLVRLPLIAFLVIGCALLPFYRFDLGPDGISYLSVSQQYLHGYWSEAINAYWSPLYSWLILPFLALHVPGILAIRIIGIASGALALFAIDRLTTIWPIRAPLHQVLLWVAALILLSFALQSGSPDLLFTALLLVYLTMVFGNDYIPSRRAGLFCGVLGGLAFLAKSFGLGFFLCHFSVTNLARWLQSRDPVARRQVLRHFLSGLVCFSVLCVTWIVTLHSKYGIWTMSTAAEYNQRLMGPQSSAYPHLSKMIAPSSQHAVSSWDDPSPDLMPPWSALRTSRHEIKVIFLNTKHLAYYWRKGSILFPVFLVGYVLLCWLRGNDRFEWVYLLGTIALLSGGYLIVTLQDRHLWPAELLILFVAFRSLHLLFAQKTFSPGVRLLFVLIAAASFVIFPISNLKGDFRRGATLYTAANEMKGEIQGPFASCGNWAGSEYLAYQVGQPYYGLVVPQSDVPVLAADLNPDFIPSRKPLPAVPDVRKELSSARLHNLLVWPDCSIDARSLGTVVGQPAGGAVLVRTDE